MGVFSVAWWVCPWRVCSLEGLFPSGCVLSCLVGVFSDGSVSLGVLSLVLILYAAPYGAYTG